MYKYSIFIAVVVFLLSLTLSSAVENTTNYYTPEARTGHTATQIGDKLYFVGGNNDGSGIYDPNANDFDAFSLDLGRNFSTASPAYTKQNIAGLPEILFAASGLAGKNNGTIYLFGGIFWLTSQDIFVNVSVNSVYSIDVSNGSATEVETSGPPPSNRCRVHGVICNGEFYIWGGYTEGFIDNTMHTLNIATSTWESIATIGDGPPPASYDFSATLLPDGRIVYIGGWLRETGDCVDIYQIWTFNTKDGKWLMNHAQGPPVSSRAQHSAVLASNGNIIVFGGVTAQGLTPNDTLIVLNTEDFTWTIPEVDNPPTVPSDHTATFYNDYMIVFGGHSPNGNATNATYILDTADGKYRWVSDYVVRDNSNITTTEPPTPSDKPTNTPLPSSQPHNLSSPYLTLNPVFVVLIICGLLLVVIFICLMIYCQGQQERNADLERHGQLSVVINR